MKLIALIAAGGVCLVCFGAPAAAQRPTSCLPRGARTLARDRLVRVYLLPATASTYACAFRGGSTVLLGGQTRHRPHLALSHIVLAGPIVADTETSYGIDSGCTAIAVTDVPTATMVTLPESYCYIDAGIIRAGGVSDLVASPHGAIAWIAYGGRRAEGLRYVVQEADFSGATSTLDEGPTVAPGSLRLNGTTVTWLKDGHAVSATLEE